MTEQEIIQQNKMIAIFDGCKLKDLFMGGEKTQQWGFDDTHITELWYEPAFLYRTPYHESYNWLIPVCRKFDRLYSDNWDIKTNEEYVELSNKLDEAAAFYEILPLYKQLFKCIEWYNLQVVSYK